MARKKSKKNKGNKKANLPKKSSVNKGKPQEEEKDFDELAQDLLNGGNDNSFNAFNMDNDQNDDQDDQNDDQDDYSDGQRGGFGGFNMNDMDQDEESEEEEDAEAALLAEMESGNEEEDAEAALLAAMKSENEEEDAEAALLAEMESENDAEAALLAEMESENDAEAALLAEMESEQEEKPVKKSKKKNKKKAKKAKVVEEQDEFDDLLASIENEEPQKPAPKKNNKKNKKNKKTAKVAEPDEFDDLLASIENEEPKKPQKKNNKKNKKNKKKNKKNQKKQQQDDDFDDLLASIEREPTEEEKAAEKAKEEKKQKEKEAKAEAAKKSEPVEEKTLEEQIADIDDLLKSGNLKKNAQKRWRKKKAKLQAELKGEKPGAKKGKKGKKNAAIEAAKERARRKLKEDEKREKEAALEKKREEEEAKERERLRLIKEEEDKKKAIIRAEARKARKIELQKKKEEAELTANLLKLGITKEAWLAMQGDSNDNKGKRNNRRNNNKRNNRRGKGRKNVPTIKKLEEVQQDKKTVVEKPKEEVSWEIGEEAKLKEDREKAELTKQQQEEKAKRQAKEAERLREIEEKKQALEPKKYRGKKLRCPIVVFVGHVDTGKTKILDYIRRTDVQDNEVGGITQQIGASYLPVSELKKKTDKIRKVMDHKLKLKIPGFLVIDTPGHASFTNLRSRGSSLCDIAVLVVNIMEGIQPQTKESVRILQERNVPFVIALNQIDRIEGWKSVIDRPYISSWKAQKDDVKMDFTSRYQFVWRQFQEIEINTEIYDKNKDMMNTVNVCPTSAHTGEGLPDLLMLMAQLTQKHMSKKLSLAKKKFKCAVLEVKKTEKYGVTLDVILVNGTLSVGDKFAIASLDGEPIVTEVKRLLTPQPLRDMRAGKNIYTFHKEVEGAIGVKIAAPGLEDAVSGSSLIKITDKTTKQEIKEVDSDMQDVLQRTVDHGPGICVQSSSLGALEAFLSFLGDLKIPVAHCGVGAVYKKHITEASIIIEKGFAKHAVLMAFNLPEPTKDVKEFAKKMGVTIMSSEAIYHFDKKWTDYVEAWEAKERAAAAKDVVFPCRLSILDDKIFNRQRPLIFGVIVEEGFLKLGTPIAVKSSKKVIGTVTSIRLSNGKDVEEARKGKEVCIKIEGEDNIMFGRQLTEKSELVSRVTRNSIDILKAYFRKQMQKEDWKLVVKLKPVFGII